MNKIAYDKLVLFNISFLFINIISILDAKNGSIQPANTIIIKKEITTTPDILFTLMSFNISHKLEIVSILFSFFKSY